MICGLFRARSGRDSGSASIWLVALLALAGCALLAALGLGAAVSARHRAEAAADLAALAAADRMLLDPAGACGLAAGTAAAQHARLTSCALRSDWAEDSVEVTVEVPMPGVLFSGLPPARGRAKAGPLYASSSFSSTTEPALSSGSLPLPHLGDWMQDGQPRSHSQAVIASRVAVSHSRARW